MAYWSQIPLKAFKKLPSFHFPARFHASVYQPMLRRSNGALSRSPDVRGTGGIRPLIAVLVLVSGPPVGSGSIFQGHKGGMKKARQHTDRHQSGIKRQRSGPPSFRPLSVWQHQRGNGPIINFLFLF